MKFWAAICAVVFFAIASARAADQYRQVLKVEPLPTALDHNFKFRKIKQYLLSDLVGPQKGPKFSSTIVRDPSIGFERSYRLFGAVTSLDQHLRYGDYLDFFWRARRPTEITVRFEYREEKLRAFIQAREVTYPRAKGSHKTSFAVIGEDFFADGRILAWRCLLVEQGRIVAETRSYLWH
ncbi:MAG: hypothetical protein ACR2HH_02535 [Chthoniobacterales bacterium]